MTCQQTFDEIDHLNEIYAGGQVVPPEFKCTVASILEHNWNWERYRLEHRSELEDFQIDQIEKMFACQKRDLGGKLYTCSCCGETKHVSFTCMSRICSHCGKIHAESWGKHIMNRYLDVPHRHVIFTLPDELWEFVQRNKELVDALFQAMDATIQRLFDDRFTKTIVRPGIIALIHYTGRDMKFNPHIHAIVTEGGLDERGKWRKHSYWPYDMMRTFWQQEVIKRFRLILPKNLEIKAFLDWVDNNRNGFVVKNYRDLLNMKDLGTYLSRYVRHPPIGESRILDYDGCFILIKYEWDNTLHTRWISVDDFIKALVDNIPLKHFKIVRYYGMYANNCYESSKAAVGEMKITIPDSDMDSLIQMSLYEVFPDDSPRCDNCGILMDLVMIEFRTGTQKVVKIL